LLVSVGAYQYISVNRKPVENAEQELVLKEETAKLEELMSKMPDVKGLEEERAKIEERIKTLSNKLHLARQMQKRTLNIDSVMNQMPGENPASQAAARTEDIINEMPEARQLKEEEAKLSVVINQLSEINLLLQEKAKSEERKKKFSEAKKLFANSLDATYEELLAIKNALVSFKLTEPQYQEAQKLLAYVNDKIEMKSKKLERKKKAIENERFEIETSALNDHGKRLKREHPNWSVEECDLISKGKIKTGMVEEQVRLALGEPYAIKANSARSKWILRENSTACVYFEGGVCVAIQQ
jgi:hypothetical protein